MSKLILASAGAGKTHRIVTESIGHIESGGKILVITYTENNQDEIANKFKQLRGRSHNNFDVKGLFTFLLEDIIRPYQSCIFQDRIETINFNVSDPHKANGRTIPGRKEIQDDGFYNPIYYLTSCNTKAHTTYLAKLAERVIKASKGKPIARLEEIYTHIYIDEVQDLIGWDYYVLKEIAKSSKLDLTCVGDFRQTIYDTSTAQKQPKTSQQKLDWFNNKMNFQYEPMNVSRRSIQCICDIADRVHVDEDYKRTESLVERTPTRFQQHTGVFVVRKSEAGLYIEKFNPTLLRHSVSSGKEFNQPGLIKMNFGKSKGLSFNRIIVLPTQPYLNYLMGKANPFGQGKTESSKNKLYVAMTRARYSLSFIIPDEFVDRCDLPVWEDN